MILIMKRFRLRAPAHITRPEIVLTIFLVPASSAELSLFRKKSPAVIFNVSQVGPAMPHLLSRPGRYCHVIGTVIALVSRIRTRLPADIFATTPVAPPTALRLPTDIILTIK